MENADDVMNFIIKSYVNVGKFFVIGFFHKGNKTRTAW